TSCNRSATWTAATATDNCTMANLIGIKYFINYGTLTVAEVHSGDTFPGGQTIVTVAATDAAGNKGTATFKVTVTDNTAPVIAGCPLNITVKSSNGDPTKCSQAASWIAPTATDNCHLKSLTGDHAPGDIFPAGTTTVTYTAQDDAGNQSTCSFTVTVI